MEKHYPGGAQIDLQKLEIPSASGGETTKVKLVLSLAFFSPHGVPQTTVRLQSIYVTGYKLLCPLAASLTVPAQV